MYDICACVRVYARTGVHNCIKRHDESILIAKSIIMGN
jgi:hypothetical protein